MEQKSNKGVWLGVVLAIVIAIGLIGWLTSGSRSDSFGSAACNGGNCTDYDAVNTIAGYWVGNVYKVIDSTGNWVGNIASSTGSAVVGTFTQGGGITASSTSASVTLAGTEFTTSNVLDYTINVGSVTLTLSASTTSICPSVAGQMRSIFIRNATTTASSNLTIAGGTGVLLKQATSSGVTIGGDTDGSNIARLDITKKANTDCIAMLSNFKD